MSSKKILLLPLDERPCNYHYPAMMPKTNCELILPPQDIMGYKKTAADTDKISKWLLENVSKADALILSLDMLIYGGIVPSRLHHTDVDTLIKRADIVKELRRIKPQLKIYAFELIMRCPDYNTSDEEPDYYGEYGGDIHKYGKYSHIEKLRELTSEEKADFELVKSRVPSEYLDDFITRRKANIAVLMHNLEFIKDGTFDYFVVPQDDSAVYGFTAVDQVTVREFFKTNILHLKTAMYPSADEIGLTLLARAVSEINDVKLKVYVKYASEKGKYLIPEYEDRIISETVKYHILTAGCVQVYSLMEADIVLAVNAAPIALRLGDPNWTIPYDIERNLAEFVNYIEYAKSQNKTVAIADVAILNRADIELTALLNSRDLLYKVDAYAAWNTSSNTIGTTLCQAILYKIGNDKDGNISFLAHRYYEDIAFMAEARGYVSDRLHEKGLTIFEIDGINGEISKWVYELVCEYMQNHYPKVAEKVDKVYLNMPWNRMFETDIKLKMK